MILTSSTSLKRWFATSTMKRWSSLSCGSSFKLINFATSIRLAARDFRTLRSMSLYRILYTSLTLVFQYYLPPLTIKIQGKLNAHISFTRSTSSCLPLLSISLAVFTGSSRSTLSSSSFLPAMREASRKSSQTSAILEFSSFFLAIGSFVCK